jgi:Virulence factor BrkB
LTLLLALWTASRGMSGLITAVNIAYEERERRGFFKLNLIAIGLTFGLLASGIVALLLVAILPAAAQILDLGAATTWLMMLAQWPLLIVLGMLGLAVLYRYGPDRDKPQWRWVSPGAIVATLLWILASVGFTIYVTNFSSYDKTYGSLGAVVILLTWLYLSALVVILGAVVNAQSERQTRKDSTEGQPQRLGHRAAHAADTLGESTELEPSMDHHQEIDKLKSRLHRESGGPIGHLAGRAVNTIASQAKALAARVQESAEARPLVSLLSALGLGVTVGLWGPHRAKRSISWRSRSTRKYCGCAR